MSLSNQNYSFDDFRIDDNLDEINEFDDNPLAQLYPESSPVISQERKVEASSLPTATLPLPLSLPSPLQTTQSFMDVLSKCSEETVETIWQFLCAQVLIHIIEHPTESYKIFILAFNGKYKSVVIDLWNINSNILVDAINTEKHATPAKFILKAQKLFRHANEKENLFLADFTFKLQNSAQYKARDQANLSTQSATSDSQTEQESPITEAKIAPSFFSTEEELEEFKGSFNYNDSSHIQKSIKNKLDNNPLVLVYMSGFPVENNQKTYLLSINEVVNNLRIAAKRVYTNLYLNIMKNKGIEALNYINEQPIDFRLGVLYDISLSHKNSRCAHFKNYLSLINDERLLKRFIDILNHPNDEFPEIATITRDNIKELVQKKIKQLAPQQSMHPQPTPSSNPSTLYSPENPANLAAATHRDKRCRISSDEETDFNLPLSPM